MKSLCLAVVALLSCLALAQAECPAIKDVPIMYNDDYFTCAQYWTGNGPSSNLAVDACNDCGLSGFTYRDDYDSSTTNGRHYPMGSIIVKAGCTLTMYMEENFHGDFRVIDGPALVANNDWGHNSVDEGCDKGPTSSHCRCQQKPISCVPSDNYHVVMTCDNTAAIEPTECTYTKTIGSSYTTTIEDHMSIDSSIEYELKAQFFGLFEESVGFSSSTGYDWTTASDETKSDEESFEVVALAPPGVTLVIEQAVGTCDGSTARTEMFKISHIIPSGEVVHQEIERSFKSDLRAKQ